MTQWHQLVIDTDEAQANIRTRECVKQFWDAYVAAGKPDKGEAWYRRTNLTRHVFVFSPQAVEIAQAYEPFRELCKSFEALPAKPSLKGFSKVEL